MARSECRGSLTTVPIGHGPCAYGRWYPSMRPCQVLSTGTATTLASPVGSGSKPGR